MDVRKTLNYFTEKKDDILCLALSFIFIVLCLVHVTLIVMGRYIEQMWMVFGTISILLLLINVPKNLLTFFAIIIFSTFVADEEFLLEVAAISQGEQLSSVLNIRNFEKLTVKPEEETHSALTGKLTELLKHNNKPEDIIHALEEYRNQLEIEEDLPGFESQDKDAILVFAKHGLIDDQVFFDLMQTKGYSDNTIADAFEKLGAADYLFNNPKNINEAQLTDKGQALAKALGARVIKGEINIAVN